MPSRHQEDVNHDEEPRRGGPIFTPGMFTYCTILLLCCDQKGRGLLVGYYYFSYCALFIVGVCLFNNGTSRLIICMWFECEFRLPLCMDGKMRVLR